MIKEDYVSFEQAKLLKEKGFPQVGLSQYDKNGIIWDPFNCPIPECSRSTLSLVQKWLREEKYLVIMVSFEFNGKYSAVIYDSKHPVGTIDSISEEYNTYEEALSIGIDKALELI